MSEIANPFSKLVGLRYKAHPWHGIEIGAQAPKLLTCFVEVVPTDTVKYEIDKASGYLKLDRPQKYSNIVPALYGFIPQTYSGELLAEKCQKATGKEDIVGDGDPLDICILTEKEIMHGDLLVKARPIGGFRMLDGNQADDKIIAVLDNDLVYSEFKDITDVPSMVVSRLKHYFLTYKDMPGEKSDCEIVEVYGQSEAYEVIESTIQDYKQYIKKMLFEG